MAHILILSEGNKFGAPIWRFAASRDEPVYVYAPTAASSMWEHGDAEGRMRCFWRPWAAVDLAGWTDEAYAAYLPCSESDFTRLCYHSDGQGTGGPFEVVTPCELRAEDATTLRLIESKTRPLRYLQKIDLCSELKAAWAYLSGIYIETSLSLFVAESECMIKALAELTKEIEECRIVSPADVAAMEKWTWRSLYDQSEQKPRLTAEQKEKLREAIDFNKQREEAE